MRRSSNGQEEWRNDKKIFMPLTYGQNFRLAFQGGVEILERISPFEKSPGPWYHPFHKKGIFFCSTNALCGVEYSKMAVKLLLAAKNWPSFACGNFYDR